MDRFEINRLKKEFPPRTRIKLLSMDDVQAPPAGTLGEVATVDDIGTIHVNWENGSGLGLIPGKDSFLVIGGADNGKEK